MTTPVQSNDIKDLLDVMAALRTPGSGCPWDLEQTFETIAPYTIEEAYEVADAIERGDMPDLKDELGDLLLQVVYHARIAEEQAQFSFDDVVLAITRKMIRRHPHVFGTPEERAAGAAPGFWERIKAEERKEKEQARAATGQPHGHASAETSVLDDVPVTLPALTRAVKLQSKAAKVGFDWPSLAPVLAKVTEELAELDEAIADGAPSEIESEFGDLMFAMANVARHLKLDPETALRRSNAKFQSRFARVEQGLAAHGRNLDEASLEEMDKLWDQAKQDERT